MANPQGAVVEKEAARVIDFAEDVELIGLARALAVDGPNHPAHVGRMAQRACGSLPMNTSPVGIGHRQVG